MATNMRQNLCWLTPSATWFLLGPTSTEELGKLSGSARAHLSRIASIELTTSGDVISGGNVVIQIAAGGLMRPEIIAAWIMSRCL